MRSLLLALALLILAPLPPLAAEEVPPPDTSLPTAPVTRDLLNPVGLQPLTLEEAIAIALAENESLKAAMAEVRAAEAAIDTAKASYWPRLDATYSGRQTHNFPDPPTEGTEPDLTESFNPEDWINALAFDLVQPIPIFGTQTLLVHAARLEHDAVEARYLQAAQTLRAEVVMSYHQTRLAQQALGVREGEVARHDTNLHNARARFAAGSSPRFDVIRAEVQRSNAEDGLIQARRTAARSLLAFQNLLGGEVPYLPMESPSIDPAQSALGQTWDLARTEEAVVIAHAYRPDLAQIRLAITQVSVGTSLLKRRPSLALAGNLTYTDQSNAFAGKNSDTVALQLRIPLWDGGEDAGQIAQGQAQREALALTLEAAEHGVALEVRDAVMGLEETRARLITATATAEQAREALRIAEVGYGEGVLIYLDLLEAQNGLTAAELNLLSAESDFHIAEATLLRAMGFLRVEDAVAALGD